MDFFHLFTNLLLIEKLKKKKKNVDLLKEGN